MFLTAVVLDTRLEILLPSDSNFRYSKYLGVALVRSGVILSASACVNEALTLSFCQRRGLSGLPFWNLCAGMLWLNQLTEGRDTREKNEL